ncbi:MAG: succinate dehydrogenase assembly factor 2 [Gammaproteobacteria bacterium]|nr:succinate dehydrogenase assembly factor 2 [Gammaproteobacteria bacterium]
MTPEQEQNRLRWRCRRGMRELDTLLMAYVDRHFREAGAAGQAAFRRLLSLPDPEIVALLDGRLRSDDAELLRVVAQVVGERLPGDGHGQR